MGGGGGGGGGWGDLGRACSSIEFMSSQSHFLSVK